MGDLTKSKESSSEDFKVPKSEFVLQFHWYIFSFFIMYFGSLIIPGIIFILYIAWVYGPFFLEMNNLLSLFLNPQSLIASFLLPLVIIGCYLLHLFLLVIITRWLWNITSRISPEKEGIIPRNVPSKTLNYYAIRSFMIKYPKNCFVKGPFPWLLNWFYNMVGSNKIGKGTTIEEQFGADKYVEIGKNSYVGVNSGFSSHSLEGEFGNLSYFKIKLGDNVTTGGINCIAPGVEIGDNSYLLPLASATKHSKLKGDNYYFGVPLRKIFKKKIIQYLDITLEDIQRDKDLINSNQSNKIQIKDNGK